MIVHDLDAFGIAARPAKADAELIVLPQAPSLVCAIAVELFGPVDLRCTQIFDARRQVELLQLTQCRALDVGEGRYPALVKERFGVGTPDRLDRDLRNSDAIRN